MSKTRVHTIKVDGLEVEVTRKQVKNLNMRLSKPDGRVRISVPPFVSDGEIKSFVRARRAWIDKHRAAIAAAPSSAAAEASPQEKQAWRENVAALTPPLIEHWELIMGVKAGKLAYREMSSRWGSCQPATGRICINTRLSLYPPDCLEYVVVHELCHLIEGGHGERFKALMDEYLPDWRKRRAKLR